jgi:glutamyl-tRNA synthetase
LSPFDIATTETVLRQLAEKYGIKAGDLIGAVRIGLTGRTAAPPIFDVIVNLGRARTVARLERLLESIR